MQDYEAKAWDISSQYLTNDQIKVYLEACLNHRVSDFKVEKESGLLNAEFFNKEEFERFKLKKTFPDQDNLFYRVWIYQYEGLKELLNNDGSNKNNNDDSRYGKGSDKEKKNLSFRFTFGNIDIPELQRENLFYKQLTENPNINFDEYKPSATEIAKQTRNLKIIFLYVNLGVPLLEDDLEVEEINEDEVIVNKKNGSIDSSSRMNNNIINEHSNPHKERYKYKYKYEFDIDRIVYYKKITFSLYDKHEKMNCACKFLEKKRPDYFWVLEDKEDGSKKYCCCDCYKNLEHKEKYKLIENTKYSIRYFLYCHEKDHNTKKYEYYCKECNRAYCIKCLTNEHKDLNRVHKLEEIDNLKLKSYKSFCKEKLEKIQSRKLKNNQKWEEINEAGDNAEKSLRERESKAIVEVKNEVLARCTFLTSLGYELQRMIAEIDNKTKTLNELKKDSNVATYLNMNNMFVEDLTNHYLPNLEYIESIDLDKYLETFHKIDKKYPQEDKKDSMSYQKNDNDIPSEEDI